MYGLVHMLIHNIENAHPPPYILLSYNVWVYSIKQATKGLFCMAPVLASAHVWCGSGTALDGAALNDRRRLLEIYKRRLNYFLYRSKELSFWCFCSGFSVPVPKSERDQIGPHTGLPEMSCNTTGRL
jgi:hypothetical protein